MDFKCLNVFVFKLYYTREFMLKVLIQFRRLLKLVEKVIKKFSFNTVL